MYTMKNKPTLCWRCDNAIYGCSWARNFVPVKNWTAVPTVIEGNTSYCVIDCPEFIPTKIRGRIDETNDNR